jgi:hypothetical protein
LDETLLHHRSVEAVDVLHETIRELTKERYRVRATLLLRYPELKCRHHPLHGVTPREAHLWNLLRPTTMNHRVHGLALNEMREARNKERMQHRPHKILCFQRIVIRWFE